MEAALHKMKMKFLCSVEFDDRTQIGAAGTGTPCTWSPFLNQLKYSLPQCLNWDLLYI